jgi:glycosyltransferase involved in cell wall biosynthesis
MSVDARMTKRWKILYIQPVAEKGGMEVNLLTELRGLNRRSFVPMVACLEDGPLVPELRATGASVVTLSRGRLRHLVKTFLTILRLARLIRRAQADLVVCENALASLYGRPAALLTGRPCILQSGGVGRPPDIVERLAYRLGPSLVIANSEFTRRSLTEAGVPAKRVVMVHRGVDLKQVQPDPESRTSVREEFGIPDRAPVVLMATRLQRGKGVHVFLDAAAHVTTIDPAVCFLIVGGALFGLEEHYPHQLHRQVERLKLNEAVRFAGFRSDVFRFYSAADVVVHSPIEPEGFGMVLVEAMACGKPVIASDSGGPREIVKNGVTGLLVLPGDATRLGQAILTLLGDPERRRRMGQAGAARVRDHFSAERMVREVEEVYEEVAERRRSRQMVRR